MKSLKNNEQSSDGEDAASQKRSRRSSTMSPQDLDDIEMVSVAPCNLLDDNLSVSSRSRSKQLDAKASRDMTYRWGTPKED